MYYIYFIYITFKNHTGCHAEDLLKGTRPLTNNPNSTCTLNSPLPCNQIESRGPRGEGTVARGYDERQRMESKTGKEAKAENGRR